jgi:hypothetical protein
VRYLKQWLQIYINSSIHVSLSASALTYITILEFGQTPNFYLLWLVFFSTIVAYNFIKYFGLAQSHHRTLTKQLKLTLWISLLAFGGCLWCLNSLSRSTFVLFLLSGAITFLYAIPIGLRQRIVVGRNLRAISGLKIFVISLVWTIVTVVIPLVEQQIPIGKVALLYAVQRFVFIMVLMLPFDIRDMVYDQLKLGTVPQLLGLFWTKIAGVIGVTCVVVLAHISQTDNSPLLITCALLLIALLKSSPERSFNYSAFWVEALPIVWLMLCLIQ